MVQEQQIEEARQQAKDAVQVYLKRHDLPEYYINDVWMNVDQETLFDDPAVLAGVVLERELGATWEPGSVVFENAFQDLIDFLAEYFDRPAKEIHEGIQKDM